MTSTPLLKPFTTLDLVKPDPLGKTPRADDPLLKSKLRIVTANSGGRALSQQHVSMEKSLSFLQDDLGRFGVYLAGLSKLPQQLHEMFGQTGRPQVVVNVWDLTELRNSLAGNVAELKNCIAQITMDSHKSAGRMDAELATHRSRLKETERIAFIDPLTGLGNRRKMELALDQLVLQARPFSLLLFDVNNFKTVNDQFGHVAGDDMLRQFATELKRASRSTDLSGRWGGDEFIVVLDCNAEQAALEKRLIQDWMPGEFVLHSGADSHRVPVSAAIGMAEWNGGEDITETLKRADAEMYRDKAHLKGAVTPSTERPVRRCIPRGKGRCHLTYAHNQRRSAVPGPLMPVVFE
jgi:diguanylate cyclase (GGDEF)-like protein